MTFVNKFKFFQPFAKHLQLEQSIKCCKLFLSSTDVNYDDSNSYQHVKVFKHQHITLISLNRPENKNKINLKTIINLKKVVSNFENDCSSTIGVLYGEGGSFCAGVDTESEELPKVLPIYNEFLQSHCKKPIIAAVSGFAYDIGLDLCLWCDMRIMEENAVMAIDRKLDISKSSIFLKRLLLAVGYSRAMDLLLTGRDLTSKEAFECGLANRIVACGSSIGQAVNMAFNIGKFPQHSINNDRSVIHNILK